MITYTVKVDEIATRWYLNDKLHREDGPAIEYSDGSKSWYLNGKLHREDGPAIEWANGSKWRYLNDQYFTEAEFNARMNPVAKELTVAEIEQLIGYTVKVVE
jgi:hypothetical protein